MAGKVEIWNMALGFLGTRTVASETERTPEALQCALFWDTARRGALRDYPWNFAQKREYLAKVPMPEVWAGEWSHAYALPRQCLKVHAVRDNGGHRRPFILVQGADGQMVLTSTACAVADFTQDSESCSLWDDAFCAAMARKLACLICVPLLKNNSAKIQELESLYRAALPEAMQADASERCEAPGEDSWLQARGGWRL